MADDKSGLLYLDPRRLKFGALAAERDMQEGLQSYFVESESFRRFRDGVKIVALGNRGSGKTAIFKMIAAYERGRQNFVLELNPEEYSYELLSQTMVQENRGSWAKHGAYASAWKFLLYVSAMKAAVKEKGLKTGAGATIYNYLRDKHDNFDKNPIAVLISYLKRLEGIKLGSYEAAVKAKELHKLYRLEEIEPLLDELNVFCHKRNVVILVDELDRGWDASEDAKAFVSGLFQAATTINLRTPNVRVIISLRRELYENIPALYEDAQKVRDVIEVIEWDEPQLRSLIAKRIMHSFPELQQQTEEELWNFAFAETLEYRNVKSFNYIIDRTLYRPREMIQFCIDIRDQAITNRKMIPANYATITQAEQKFSEDRVKDIAAEYRFQFPGLLGIFETFRGRSYNLERDDLEYHCLMLAAGEYHAGTDAKWCIDMEIEPIIDILWRVGFLRAQAVGGIKARRRSGSEYLGAHQVSSLNLQNIKKFHIHPLFRAYLGLKEQRVPYK